MDFTDFLNAIGIGIVQGVTEFLPISSSGHLLLYSWIFQGKTMPLELNLALHFGSSLAILIYFWRDWRELAKNLSQFALHKQKSFESQVLFPSLVLGSIPAAVMGLGFEKAIKSYFHTPTAVVSALFIVGILLWLVDKFSPTDKNYHGLTIKDAIFIGFAQAAALIPGVSRSGGTIIAGRLRGLDRPSAAKFSFLLGTPVILGATLIKAPKILDSALANPQFYVGTAVSFIASVAAIHFLLLFLQKFSLVWFAIYRCLLAMIAAYFLF